jgi:hypothetical protein
MARILEVKQGPQARIRQGVWKNRRDYQRSEEPASDIDVWAALSNVTALRSSVARDFASAIGMSPQVVEVWLTDVLNDLSIAVALSGSETEIEVRTTFLDLVMERLDPQEGDLHVFPTGSVPDWVKRGEQLI